MSFTLRATTGRHTESCASARGALSTPLPPQPAPRPWSEGGPMRCRCAAFTSSSSCHTAQQFHNRNTPTRQHALGRQLALERVPDRVVIRLIAAAADAARARARSAVGAIYAIRMRLRCALCAKCCACACASEFLAGNQVIKPEMYSVDSASFIKNVLIIF